MINKIEGFHSQLTEILRKFDLNISDVNDGKNKQMKATATKICEDAISKAENLIFNNEELFSIWIKKYPPTNPFDQEDFFTKKYFSSRMTDYLALVK